MKDDRLYLIHIRECIEKVELYTRDGEARFFEDSMIQDSVLRNFQILSESSQHISAELKEAYPKIEWKNLAGLRNILAHDYLNVNMKRVWLYVTNDLPKLRLAIEKMLEGLNRYRINT